MKPYYLTTTLPYVNAAPHIGFALEVVQADVVARYHKLLGYDVVFNTGTDEHGAKIYEKACEAGMDPQAYVDENAAKFDLLKSALNLTYTNFIRTTDAHHVVAAQEFWRRCAKIGDIYKKLYKAKYCVGCELEKTDSELENGKCPLHPARELEVREEENYFFRFSKYAKNLIVLYESKANFVVPESRLHEVKIFVEGGLQDFSISRLKAKMPWGIAVPDDDEHVMYVWFDALVNYISILGWPEDLERFEKFWPGVQFAGKDNLRQQSAMWQAMLFSAGFPPSKQVVIHGFITSGGEKMSKSAGNVVDPIALVKKYGADAVRYWLLREMNPFEDGDFTQEKFDVRYQADLANGIGNYASRALALGEKNCPMKNIEIDKAISEQINEAWGLVNARMGEFRFHEALHAIWNLISFGDGYINEEKPWEGSGNPKVVFQAIVILDNVAAMLCPFMPETSSRITERIHWKTPQELSVIKGESLFPRLEL